MMGHKSHQGQPLLHRMVELGWVGVSINYRLAPRDAYPAQIIDVKKAIAWVKTHIEEYGGDGLRHRHGWLGRGTSLSLQA